MSSSTITGVLRKAKSSTMPGIPEEKLGADGRPVSFASPDTMISSSEGKRGPVSETTEASPSCQSSNGKEHEVRTDGNLAIPREVQQPTVFGPRNEYKAVPLVLEYYTSKGRSKVSVREAKPEEAKVAMGRDVPIVTDVPRLAEQYTPRDDPDTMPRLSDLQARSDRPPSRSLCNDPDHSARKSHISDMRTNSIRSSTTEIRISTVSEDEDGSELSSNDSTLLGPGSPPQRLVSIMNEKPILRCKPPTTTHIGGDAFVHSVGLSPFDTSKAASAFSRPISEVMSPSSRFSWHQSKEDKARNWFARWFIDWWAMEVLSLLFSAICMTIIITILSRVDRKEMPKW